MPHVPLEQRKQNFGEVELGFDEAAASREAKRCLSCRRCIGCGLCLAECDPKAVEYDQQPKTFNLKVNSVILTPGFDEFDAGRIPELGYRKYPNVITSIELERMLAPTGPYGGYVLRPYDGRVPGKIAFIQCVGSRNEAIGADFCSSICCMTAMKEALALTALIPDSKITILHRDIRPLGKGSEEFYQRVVNENRIKLTYGPVTKVTEVAENKNLSVEFTSNGHSAPSSGAQGVTPQGSKAQGSAQEGELRQDTRVEEFDLVVLSVGVRAAGKALSRKAGVRLDKYGFCTTDSLSLNPVATSKAGILSAGSFTAPMDVQSSVLQADAAAAIALRTLAQPAGAQESEAAGGRGAGGASAVSNAVLVIGSGLAGLVAANELARMGHDVVMIEKDEDAGGTLSRYEFKLDEKSEKNVVSVLLEAANGNSKIRILTSTELSSLSGGAGEFSATFKTGAVEKFGAVIVCTGGHEHIPEGLLHGKNVHVLTQLELGRALARDEIAKTLAASQAVGGVAACGGAPASGGAVAPSRAAGTAPTGVPSIVMIQCVGSRSSDWPVCSRVCCAQALRNALAVKKVRPDARVTILHRDIRVYGLEEELLTEALERGIEFVGLKDSAALVPRGTTAEIAPVTAATKGSQLTVTFQREGTASAGAGGESALPGAAAGEGAACGGTVRDGVARVVAGGLGAAGEETARQSVPPVGSLVQKESIQADYVVLSAGLRPSQEAKGLAEVLGLEIDSNGFFKELHPELKPVETSRKGIYICGLAHSSQTAQDTITQAMAAARKASSGLHRV